MKRYNSLNFAFVLLLSAMVFSCKKIIKVNLNTSSPRYVVEANITDKPGPYLVMITKSVNFDQDNVYPTVSGALVIVTDATTNQADTLKEVTPGNYNTSSIAGVPGHTYRLYINAAGNVFKASSTMPMAVTLDSLYTQTSAFGGTHPQLVPVYTDPATPGNYYHFMEYKNDTESDNVIIRNDNLVNGQVNKLPIGGDDLIPGDSLALYLECIDSAIYQYYYSLQQTENQSAATPANPLTNITGGALGYFSAHTSSFRSIIIQ